MDGPLAPFATDLRRALAGSGYSLRSTGELMRLAAQLSRWLDSRSLTADELTAAVAGEFFRARRADGCRRWLTSRSLGPLLECLRIAPADTVGGIPVEGLLAQYRDYLRSERGLADSTVSQYLRHAAAFISRAPAGSALAELTAGQITEFVMAWCRQRNASLLPQHRRPRSGRPPLASAPASAPRVPGHQLDSVRVRLRLEQRTALI